MRRTPIPLVVTIVLALVTSTLASTTAQAAVTPINPASITHWVYQLQNYKNDKLDQVAAARGQVAVVDMARDGSTDYFSATEIGRLKASGKKALAYFEIGSIENYRPEYSSVRGLRLNSMSGWPGEYYVKYWDESWWRNVVKPRVDQAIRAGFNGVYLDTVPAYEEINLRLVPGETRASLALKMVALLSRISAYAKALRPGFLVVPQNAPELRLYSTSYLRAIDGIGMEDLFYSDDRACTASWCAENLRNAMAVRASGKFVLAVDYAVRSTNVSTACTRYRALGFAGYVTVRDLDRVRPACP